VAAPLVVQTYGNACLANCACAEVRYQGECSFWRNIFGGPQQCAGAAVCR
jgi:hypothetical protein